MAERTFISSHDTMQFPSLLIVDDAFPWDEPPFETLSLSILKLDASSFCVDVAKVATVAELKQAVEAAFNHMPRKGPGKISWSHVWGQFCLSYRGRKLLTETDHLRDYGIKDGDQLHFMRHVSSSCSFKRKPLKKRVVNWRSMSQVNRHQQQEQKDDDIDLKDIVIENVKIEHCSAEENCEGKSRSGFLGGLFSYTRLARRARVESRICPSMITRGIVNSFRKFKRILRYCRRQHYSRTHTLTEY